jgi:polyisoprenoid-binding protein YceI
MTDTGAPTTLSGKYSLDPAHSRIGFVARHAMVTKVRGAFNDVEGSGFFDADNPGNSHFQLTIKAHSIDSGNPDRDNHLRTNDFFDMDNHPEITFAATAVEKVDDDTFKVTGDLTIKGTTHPVTFDLELSGPVLDPFGSTRIGLEGSTQVNRKDWGITWNAPLETGGFLVSEKVTLEFDIAAVKQADES